MKIYINILTFLILFVACSKPTSINDLESKDGIAIDPVTGEPFTPYENTEAFEAVVIGWLEGSLDVTSMQASIAANIQSQITPVNEDLYFTWQNPTPPVPPIEE